MTDGIHSTCLHRYEVRGLESYLDLREKFNKGNTAADARTDLGLAQPSQLVCNAAI